MGRLALIYLDDKVYFTCKSCNTHLTPEDQLISRDYRAATGKGVNIVCGDLEDKELSSGVHTICDIFCLSCMNKEFARDQKNKFKEGRYILERALISKCIE